MRNRIARITLKPYPENAIFFDDNITDYHSTACLLSKKPRITDINAITSST